MTSSTAIDLSVPTFCVVTGASQGIGRAIAVEISKVLGPKSILLLLARNKKELAITANLCQSHVKIVYNSVDLETATEKELGDILKEGLMRYKPSDFVVPLIFHNVGSIGNLSVETVRIEDVDELRKFFDLNLFKVIALNTQFLKMFEGKEDRMIMVNITSVCAIKPMSGMAYYCMGKAAREMYFKVLAEEKKNIKILNYSPGPVETSLIDFVLEKSVNENLREVFTTFKNQGTLLKPEQTAKKCVKLLLAGKFGPGEHIDYFDNE